jgi:phosphoadenosine phosphosulfate reductase
MAGVPSNALLDQGYKSIGDWHSTVLPKEGESERSGRWASNKTKTECGLHKVRLSRLAIPPHSVLTPPSLQDYFAMKRAFEKKQIENSRAEADKARGEDPEEVGESSVAIDGKAEDLGASFSDLRLGA